MTSYMLPPPKYQLILASQSQRRKHLLAEAGILLDDVIAADIDETPIKNERPADYVLRMACLLYTSPSPRDLSTSRMPSSA